MTETVLEARRHLTIVFSDVSNSTQIASQLEPEVYKEFLDQVRKIIHKVLKTHGGIDIRIDGDGVLFIFGYPDSYEDAGRRATEAVLDLHRGIANIDQTSLPNGLKFDLHTGIHSGVVLLRSGSMVHGRYEILGDPTNVAKRLCDFAGANEIIVSDNSLGIDRHFFNIGQTRRINIRGKEKKILIHNIVGRVDTPNRYLARVKRGISPFAGRQEDIRKLYQCLKKVKSGRNQFPIVSASAGVGKTRLISEFLEQLSFQGYGVHQGFCESYLGARPLQPIAQLAHSILMAEYGLPRYSNVELIKEYIDDIDENIMDSLKSLLALTTSDENIVVPKHDNILMAFRGLLNGVNSESPLVLFVDDWQWVDDASRRVLDLLHNATEQPFLFVRATREQEHLITNMDHTEIINLDPLKEDEAQYAIENLLDSPEPFIVDKIKALTGGNPLFIEELCHSVEDGKYAFEQDGGVTPLETLIHSRFARLPKSQAKLVETASVIGHMIPTWLFQDITGISPGHEEFSSLNQNDFIYLSDMSGMLKFKHGIARDVIYNLVNFHERTAIHGRIVDALHRHSKNKTENVEALAYHYSQCGISEKASHYAILAGDKASVSSALDLAQTQYRQALKELSLLDISPETSEKINSVIRKFGIVSIVDPSWEQVPVLKNALDLTRLNNDRKGEAWAQYWLGFIYYGLGEPSLAIGHLELARKAATTLESSTLLIHSEANLGQAYGAATNYQKALVFLNRSISVKETLRLSEGLAESLAYSQSCKGFILADQGKFKAADRSYEGARKVISTALGREMSTWLANHRSASRLWQGRYDDAIDEASCARDIAEGQKSRYHFAMANALIYGAKLHKQFDAEVLEQLIEITDWMTRSASQQFISLNYGWLTRILVGQGDFEQARHFAAKAFLRARKGDRLGEAMTCRALANLSNKGQTRRSVRYYLRKAYYSARLRLSSHERAKTQLCEVEIALTKNDFERASECLFEAQKTFESLNMQFHLMKVEQLLVSYPQLVSLKSEET